MSKIHAYNTRSGKHEDFFPTHPAWTRALLNHVRFDGIISEPCAGDGAVVRVLEANGYTVDASDLVDRGAGYRVESAFHIERHENVVTNPPYSDVEDLIEHWLKTTERKIAVLVRMGLLEGQRRYNRLFSEHPPAMVVIIPERMPVPGVKSQSFNHIWLIWEPGVTTTKLVWASSRVAAHR